MIGLENGSVSFGSRCLFKNISFNLPRGRSMAILGPNGRGKTTLLRAVLGFQKLTSGSRIVPDIVGYVPQHGASSSKLSGLDVVTMGRARNIGLFGQPKQEDRDASMSAMVEVGACGLSEMRYDRMSGGQRQLILISRALATGAEALLFDEPTSALDLGNVSKMLGLLARLRDQRERAILFTTHDPNHALVAADDVLMMMPDGREQFGPVSDMICPNLLAELYGVEMVWVNMPDGRQAILPAFAGMKQ